LILILNKVWVDTLDMFFLRNSRKVSKVSKVSEILNVIMAAGLDTVEANFDLVEDKH
jgi:hypothetical protein